MTSLLFVIFFNNHIESLKSHKIMIGERLVASTPNDIQMARSAVEASVREIENSIKLLTELQQSCNVLERDIKATERLRK